MEKINKDINIQFNIEKFKNLSDDEIKGMFDKSIIPEVLKMRAQGLLREDCPVCNPWSYSVF